MLEITPMERGHLGALAELERQCFSKPWSFQALEEELENPGACFLVALEGGEVLGYGGIHCAWGQCYLDNVAVFRRHRGKGVAAALLAALEREARARKGEFLSLEVRPSNTAAVALYTRLGFVQEGRRKDFYTHPREDGLILTKRFETGAVPEKE